MENDIQFGCAVDIIRVPLRCIRRYSGADQLNCLAGKLESTQRIWADFFRLLYQSGRERFNIFCAPCHSRVGDGNGFVPSRGFARKPPSFHDVRLQKAPLGYFFDVITEGFGIMPDYAAQIPPQDRWDIVAYVRALQLSQNATMADVPAGQAIPSEPPKFLEPGSGASLPVVVPETNSKTEPDNPGESK